MTASKISFDGGSSVVISAAAEKFMRRMTRFGGLSGAGGFRLVVKPGGCSGLSSEFSIEAAPMPGDETVAVNGLKVFLPAESARLLRGVTIDFVDSPMQSGLKFFDPNATSTCGDSARPSIVQLSAPPHRQG